MDVWWEVLGEVLGEVFEQHLPFGNPCVYRLSRRKGEVGRCYCECRQKSGYESIFKEKQAILFSVSEKLAIFAIETNVHFKASLLSKIPERAKRKRQRLSTEVGDVVAFFD